MDPMELLFTIKDNVSCGRCTQRYLRRLSACPHCDGLSDYALADFLRKKEREAEAHVQLGYVFGFIAVMLLLLVVSFASYL